mmetsp:Transcript_37403/g.84734  ORF Transcript_37403/g.84734 Transcript_37403/m.84734 type:complete len:280 (-) Transcript_37403:579-1418(-)
MKMAGEMQPEEDSMLTEMDAVALSNKECVVVSVPATNSPEAPALGEGATTLQSASGDEVLQSNGMEPPAQEASALVAGQIPPEKMMAEATVVTAPAAEAAEAVGPVNSGSIVAVEVREDEEEAKDRSNAKVHFGRKKAQGFTRLENTDAPPADVHREAPSFRGFWIHLSLPRFYALLPVAIVCGLLIGVNTRRAMVDLLSASAEQALVSGPQILSRASLFSPPPPPLRVTQLEQRTRGDDGDGDGDGDDDGDDDGGDDGDDDGDADADADADGDGDGDA